MRDALAIQAAGADLVHVSRLTTSAHVLALALQAQAGRPRLVLDLDDVDTVKRRRWLNVTHARKWRRAIPDYYDLLRLWAYQRRAIRAFDRVLVCSDHDRDLLRLRDAVVIPNGADVPARPFADESDGCTLLYCGTLSYWPNIDGLLYFVQEVLPHIRRTVPKVRLLVVGKDPAPEVLALHDGETLVVEPDVPSVEKYYRQATVAVVPLRVAGGTRLKILEAFALGCPVVSTTIGCEGLKVNAGEHLVVADESLAFATACITLLEGPELRRRLASSGRRLVERLYAWPYIEQRLTDTTRAFLGS
jgi:glycosyltransferase involved in cell wall biosynthesis